METAYLIVIFLKVGWFGNITRDYTQVSYESMDKCKEQLVQQYERHSTMRTKRTETQLMITDDNNYTIKVFSCK